MKHCRKCLIRELDKDEYFRNIYEYIESIPNERKTLVAEYEERLSKCRDCNKLINGMCLVCGCFVEVRAAVAVNRCPDIKKKW